MPNYKMTLREWLKTEIPIEEILYNTSLDDNDKRLYKLPDDGLIDEPIGVSLFINKDELKNINIYVKNNNINKRMIYFGVRPRNDENRRKNCEITRAKCVDNLIKNGYRNECRGGKGYLELLCSAKFAPSPESNGIDCHRHWEALYCKSIPIVEDNELIKPKFNNLPVLYTKDYTEINDKYLQKVHEEMLDKEFDFSKLFISGYDKDIQEKIRRRSNHWCRVRKIPQFYE